jgi:hypothetical protein
LAELPIIPGWSLIFFGIFKDVAGLPSGTESHQYAVGDGLAGKAGPCRPERKGQAKGSGLPDQLDLFICCRESNVE